MYRLVLYCLLITSILSLGACEDKVEEPVVLDGDSYFPMQPGHWVIYQVDSTIYDAFLATGSKITSWQVKEELGKRFTDNEGRSAITIKRYIRQDSTVAWSDEQPIVWYAVKEEDRAERVEGDRRFMKMVFPISEFREWDGNVYINDFNETNTWYQYYRYGAYADWTYTYSQIETPFQINNLTFDKSITIAQQDKENLIEKLFGTEVYAPNVGLVYREEWILKTQDSSQGGEWPDRATQGHVVKMKVVDYKGG